MHTKNLSYYLILLFTFTIPSYGLGYNADPPLNNTERLTEINKQLVIAKTNLRKNSKESLKAALVAQELSLDFNPKKLVESNLCIAQVYQQKGSVDTALLILKDALLQIEKLGDDTLSAEAYHTLGMNYQYSGSFDLAIESYHEALNINVSLGMHKSSMRQLNNIGLLYREEEEYELALEYLEKCLRISGEKGFKTYEYYSYLNVGYILMKQNKWDEALERFETTLKLPEEESISYCTVHYLISDVKLNQNDIPGAKEFANKALVLANKIDYAVGKVFCQRVLSDVYLKEKKYDKARALANKTLKYLQQNSVNIYLEDVLKVLYNIEYETGNYKRAIKIQKRLFARKDSLMQIRTKEKFSNSEYKYQLLKNEKENQLLKVKNENSSRVSLLAILIAFLLLLSVLSAYFAYRKSKDYNIVLQKAIDERTKELENSNTDLAQSNQELERFAFIASHDLKTPLRDIVSFTGLLERRLKSHGDQQVHEYLSFIKKGGIRLNNLIIDTLEYSRLSYLEKENEIQLVDLNQLLSELKTAMSIFIEEKNASIKLLNPLPKIKANNSSLTLLFQNLIENSIKYNTSQTPTIKISSQENQQFLSIFIEDNGIGISEEYHDEIFVMFSRLHTQNNYEGSGLGLSICKKVVEKLKGEIHLKSKPDKGSIFEIRLPTDLMAIEDIDLKVPMSLNN